jgi:hypothetical protein
LLSLLCKEEESTGFASEQPINNTLYRYTANGINMYENLFNPSCSVSIKNKEKSA